MGLPLLATSSPDTVAIGVTVLATLVVLGLVVAVVALLAAVRDLRRQAEDLAREAGNLLEQLGSTVRQAGLEVERVDRMVGSAEALSDVVGSASRLMGGAVASPFIKVLAFGSGLVRGAKLVRSGAPLPVLAPIAEGRGQARRVAKSARGALRSSSRRPSGGAKATSGSGKRRAS